jgi:hypothetical protein
MNNSSDIIVSANSPDSLSEHPLHKFLLDDSHQVFDITDSKTNGGDDITVPKGVTETSELMTFGTILNAIVGAGFFGLNFRCYLNCVSCSLLHYLSFSMLQFFLGLIIEQVFRSPS